MRQGDIEQMVAGTIKVVQLLPELNLGGVERGTLEMGRFLAAEGHHSIVISAGGRLVSTLEKEGSRHVAWRIGKKSPAVLRYVPLLRRLLVEEGVDILHARSRVPAWVGYAAWRSLSQRTRPRFVTTFHGYYSVNGYSAVMTKGERIIAVSKAIASHIMERYGIPENRIEIIYRGVDETIFDPEVVAEDRIRSLRQRWGLNGAGPPIIMLPARLTSLKGHDFFIQSLAMIRSLNWYALCVGDTGENESYLNRLREMILQQGLENRIRFVGHCDDMPAALMLADVVVSATSTHAEAFSRIVLEAQAMEKPVVATAHGGSLEAILDRETGWLVEPMNPKAMADALEQAIHDPALRQRMGLQAKAWVRRHFTTRNMCRQTLALYNQLLQEPRPNNSGE